MDNLQAMINGMSQQWQRERAATQMTLGDLINTLKITNPDFEIQKIEEPHSYRGYYCDLAFSLVKNEKMKVSEAIEVCHSVMGRVLEGYKGGEYLMGENTPIWLAHYGSCGVKIDDLSGDGIFLTQEDE